MAAAGKTVALVTGGNTGIGFHIVRLLANARPQWTVLLGARDHAKADEAVKKLQLANVKPIVTGDVDNKDTVKAAAEEVRKTYGDQPVGLLVNNAGWAAKGDAFDEKIADASQAANFRGPLNVIDHFLPLIQDNGRIVIVSSGASIHALKRMRPDVREKFLRASSIDEIRNLLQEFTAAVAKGDWEQKGYPKTAYGMSKAGITLATRVLGKSLPRGITISAGCPGWCRTSMAGDQASRSAEEGAATILKMCLESNANGAYFDQDHNQLDVDKVTSE